MTIRYIGLSESTFRWTCPVCRKVVEDNRSDSELFNEFEQMNIYINVNDTQRKELAFKETRLGHIGIVVCEVCRVAVTGAIATAIDQLIKEPSK